MRLPSLVFCLACLVALASCKTLWSQLEGYQFEDYVLEFHKQYSPQEYKSRRDVFEQNVAVIKAHNIQATWKMGVNHLTDRTDKEFRQLLGYKPVGDLETPNKIKYEPSVTKAAPKSIDWRNKNIITAVKDQGQCGSCWTFGTTETVESYYALKSGQLADLSEQQILDCVPNPNDCGGSGGCGGGIAELAYEGLIKMGGMASEWTYPYASYFGKNFSCQFGKYTPPIAVLKGYVVLPSNEYNPVIEALSSGPLVVNVDASAWSSYESGVFTACNTSDSIIDHVVQLVGYGTDSTAGDFWIIRNSWTTAWGEDGFMRIARSSNVTCTPDTIPGAGTGCNGGPLNVSVCGPCGILYDVSYPVIA